MCLLYFQVQTQVFMCKVNYCDFCVYTFPTGYHAATITICIETSGPECQLVCKQMSTIYLQRELHQAKETILNCKLEGCLET